MRIRNLSGAIPLFMAGILVASALLGAPAGAKGLIQTTLGDEVDLSGSTGGSWEMYLFITGPNLPSNGARLENPRSGVVTGAPGSFTQPDVTGNGWYYTWQTSGIGLDAGSYTVWAINMPVGKNDLRGSNAEYSTTTVQLSTSALSVNTDGSLSITTYPAGASVTLDGVYKGTSAIVLKNVAPGTHTVTVELEGYEPVTQTVSVPSGDTAELVLTLTAVETVTATAVETTAPPTQATTSAPAPLAAALLAPGLAALAIALNRR